MVNDISLADERADDRCVLADIGVLKPMDDPGDEIRQYDDQQGLPQHSDDFIHALA